jgi:predicted GNAT family N-acyltransferase
MGEKYSKELVEKYLKEMKKQFPDTDLHLLEIAVLQYIFLDCDENYKPDENNEDYLKAKELYNQKEFKTILLNEEIISKT